MRSSKQVVQRERRAFSAEFKAEAVPPLGSFASTWLLWHFDGERAQLIALYRSGVFLPQADVEALFCPARLVLS